MNYIEIKKNPDSSLIPITYDKIVYDNGTFVIAIKINCNKVEFVQDEHPHKYRIIDSNSKHIEIEDNFNPDDKSNYNLKFYFNSEGIGEGKEFILKITVPINKLKDKDELCTFKFNGASNPHFNKKKGRPFPWRELNRYNYFYLLPPFTS